MSEPNHWFEPIAEHLGAAYLRYSFTKGTGRRSTTSSTRSACSRGSGCSTSAAGRGATPTSWPAAGSRSTASTSRPGSSSSPTRTPRPGATFERLDARALPFDAEFDAAICLCQGAFGLMTADGDDEAVLAGIARALRPGGRLALTAFNAYFAREVPRPTPRSTPTAGSSHERTEVRDPAGQSRRGRPVDRVLHAAGAAPARPTARPERRADQQRRAGRLRRRPADHRVAGVPRHRRVRRQRSRWVTNRAEMLTP